MHFKGVSCGFHFGHRHLSVPHSGTKEDWFKMKTWRNHHVYALELNHRHEEAVMLAHLFMTSLIQHYMAQAPRPSTWAKKKTEQAVILSVSLLTSSLWTHRHIYCNILTHPNSPTPALNRTRTVFLEWMACDFAVTDNAHAPTSVCCTLAFHFFLNRKQYMCFQILYSWRNQFSGIHEEVEIVKESILKRMEVITTKKHILKA